MLIIKVNYGNIIAGLKTVGPCGKTHECRQSHWDCYCRVYESGAAFDEYIAIYMYF